MLRSVAVQRINDAIGFRPAGNSLEPTIILRLQEAQRDLERGKSLPWFLLVEDEALVLLEGDHTIALPERFLREADDATMRLTPSDVNTSSFLIRRYYNDAAASLLEPVENDPAPAAGPKAYVLRQSTIDFLVEADQDYDITWSYYRGGALLTSDIENVWLAEAPEWLIGEAGRRLALDLRQADAVALFTEMRQHARAAILAEEIARELSWGPLEMGANQ